MTTCELCGALVDDEIPEAEELHEKFHGMFETLVRVIETQAATITQMLDQRDAFVRAIQAAILGLTPDQC